MTKAVLTITQDDAQVALFTAEIDNFDQLEKIKETVKSFFSNSAPNQPTDPAQTTK